MYNIVGNNASYCMITISYELVHTGMATQLSTLQGSVERSINSIQQEISQLSHPPLGSFLNPAPSCQLIQQGSPSGHYWIQHTGTGYANLEYCHMTRRCCNSTGGWMRVAHLNMTDSNQRCPSGFRLITSPKRTCGTPGSGCVHTTFPLNGVKYSRVCGKIIAYQYSSPEGFGPYYHNNNLTIDDPYVDGVSLTHGQDPRKHIWTFVNAKDESRSKYFTCPCTSTDKAYAGVVPPFIGQDYFCDTGSESPPRIGYFYRSDPLWDGSGCGTTSSCCTFNNPPWFCKQLLQPTSDDIEMRVCLNAPNTNEDIALEHVDIYVQ